MAGDQELTERFPPPDRPWTEQYADVHRRFVCYVLDDEGLLERFRAGSELPLGYGIGLDERVVEFPWLLCQGLAGDVLDAGSALNHAHVLDRVLPEVRRLHIATLAPEATAFHERGVSYVFSDLRDLPYRDGLFDQVVSISTLEHVGMDNTMYGTTAPRAADPAAEVEQAMAELRRVLSPEGLLFVTLPYGMAEDHGWFRQFGKTDVARLISDAHARDVGMRVYRYSRAGWQTSGLDEASAMTYRDYQADPRPVPDLAAAARAVVCLSIRF